MKINTPQVFDYIKEANGTLCRLKVIDIGAWNMLSTASVSLAHGLTVLNILSVTATIIADAQNDLRDLCCPDSNTSVDGAIRIGATNLDIFRVTGGFFDAGTYDDTGINRGYLVVWYKD